MLEGPNGFASVSRHLAELRILLDAGGDARTALRAVLQAFAQTFGFRHAAVLVKHRGSGDLRVQAAFGEAAKSLETDVSLPLSKTAWQEDLISSTFHQKKDLVVPDAFDERTAPKLPRVYFEAIGSPAFALYVVQSVDPEPRLLFADTDYPDRLPTQEHAAFVERFRELVARASAAAEGRIVAPQQMRAFTPKRL
jgi:hypothetical protein